MGLFKGGTPDPQPLVYWWGGRGRGWGWGEGPQPDLCVRFGPERTFSASKVFLLPFSRCLGSPPPQAAASECRCGHCPAVALPCMAGALLPISLHPSSRELGWWELTAQLFGVWVISPFLFVCITSQGVCLGPGQILWSSGATSSLCSLPPHSVSFSS